MDRFALYANDAVGEDDVRATYRYYLGREPAAETLAAIVENGTPLGRLEQNILTRSYEYWSKGPLLATHRRGPWDGSILLMHPARVFFYPIAKVANTSVKNWALRLSGHDDDAPVHKLLDGGKVKLQARYNSERQFSTLMRDPDWARVAILRDPLDRLVSCYWDKFVRNRAVESVLHHTRPVYQFLYGEEAPTKEQIQRGVTFRQFCHYINLTPREKMDPHWAPQSRYLETFRWDHLFRIDRIDAFERFVLDRCPPELRETRLGMQNVAPRDKAKVDEILTDMAPRHLDKYQNLPNDVFLSPDIGDFVRDYFALDYLLLEQARG